jgi:hypothetical protein
LVAKRVRQKEHADRLRVVGSRDICHADERVGLDIRTRSGDGGRNTVDAASATSTVPRLVSTVKRLPET